MRGKGKRAFREVVCSGVKTEEAEEMIKTLESASQTFYSRVPLVAEKRKVNMYS